MSIKNQPTLVVLDNDIEIQDLISAFFKPKNYHVLCYSDPEVLIQESLSKGSCWDLLLCDDHFHNMKIDDFNRKLAFNLPRLPVLNIALNKNLLSKDVEQSEGDFEFNTKHIHFGELQMLVQNKLNENVLKNETSQRSVIKAEHAAMLVSVMGSSPCFLAALDVAKRVAKSKASILISGESGTGKEVFANFIHLNSKCNKGPFIAINCSSIPENLLESELFGHAKGSFTGAIDKRTGLFEAAENGTLFLDEIGDLSLLLQAKLLRVLQERKIKRVGENIERPINCRVISATHKDLQLEVDQGRFREDLFFRLNVIPIPIPPLRDRQEDIIVLAEFFLKKFAARNESKAETFSENAIQYLVQNKWRGNIRELENTVERSVVLSENAEITFEEISPLSSAEFKSESSDADLDPMSQMGDNTFSLSCDNHLPCLEEVINKYIAFAIQKNGGAKDKTAKEIGIDRKTLYRRMQVFENPTHFDS